MIEKLKNEDFDQIYELMEMSFPCDEYRPYDEQKALLDHPMYSIYLSYHESQAIKGFIAVWDFQLFAFIEHFAVKPEYRNSGVGASVLNEVVELLEKTVCLEVELPETEIASRRIRFYERNHFFLNEYPYVQPPISHGKNAIPMFVMTSGRKVDENTFRKMKDTLYTEVYQYKG